MGSHGARAAPFLLRRRSVMAVAEARVTCLNDLVPRPVDWLWPHILPAGKLTLIDGDPSQGKSLMTLDLAARLTTARALPDGYQPPEPCGVVLVGAEDNLEDTVLPRLLAAGADPRRVHAFRGPRCHGRCQRPPVFPGDCDLLGRVGRDTGSRL